MLPSSTTGRLAISRSAPGVFKAGPLPLVALVVAAAAGAAVLVSVLFVVVVTFRLLGISGAPISSSTCTDPVVVVVIFVRPLTRLVLVVGGGADDAGWVDVGAGIRSSCASVSPPPLGLSVADSAVVHNDDGPPSQGQNVCPVNRSGLGSPGYQAGPLEEGDEEAFPMGRPT